MAERVAIIGAGGKMGSRIVNNLLKEDYELIFSEKSEAGIERLKEKGLAVTPSEQAAAQAGIIVLAVPDALIGAVSRELVPLARAGAAVILLDPAAAAVHELEVREDLNYVVCHPCHPPLFGEQATPEARKDFFGGITASQDIVIALMTGSEEAFEKANELCCKMFAPVVKAHRITVEQMAVLEPAMAEVVAASAACLMRDAMEEAVKAGVPREAAESFMMGHSQIALAIAFGAIGSPFSDAAKVAIRWGNEMVYRPDWRKVFESEKIREVIHEMIHPEEKH
ncbi:MAG: phosphogluconate dehydrogenase C-terminal domain-containing protein [Armatimonadota bacterium]|nr:phosphogluconate dehydrogenase C-terminal domain-containing protein [Armatimonadota bacterium]